VKAKEGGGVLRRALGEQWPHQIRRRTVKVSEKGGQGAYWNGPTQSRREHRGIGSRRQIIRKLGDVNPLQKK